jgi:hypothetical protein
LFYFFIVLFVLSLIVTGIYLTVRRNKTVSAADRRGIATTMGVFWGITALVCLIACIQTVGTKDVGIETSFGKTAGELGPGIHLTPPWINVTTMDAAIQTDSYTKQDCLSVRVAYQQTACVHVSIRWRIEPNDADSLFQNYRTFENVRDSLVTRELTTAVNNQLENYNPLNSVAGAQSSNPPLQQIAQNVTAQMQSEIGRDGIHVLNTLIPFIGFDPETQGRINQLQQQVALTRIADQEIVTNKAQAQANGALARSVNKTPNVLVAQCLTILNQMVKQGQSVPAGFSCWPGGSLTGVIANTTKK